jgi:osmoprotectant transport system permease protein
MTWALANLGLIWGRTLDHIVLSLPPIVLCFVIAVPLGWLARRYTISRGVILTGAGLLYAVPSLPLFFVLPAVIGTGLRSPLNVIIALTLYGVALMAMGYSGWTRFWQVELPLAGPVLLAGMRVVAVSTVSLVTVGAVIGVQSLGSLFTDGFQRGIQAEIIAGLVATVGLALAFDGALVLLGRILMPWTRRTAPARVTTPIEVSAA